MTTKNTYQLLSVFFTFFLTFNSNAYTGNGVLTSGGITRTFTYHYPGTVSNSNLPLMIVYHGDNNTGNDIRISSGFDAISDANNFIVVYPDAINTFWNSYVDDSPGSLDDPNAPDDVLFTSDLIDYFCLNFNINRNKVYASGHSAGGFMCYNLSIKLNSQIAAIAPVSANIYGDQTILDTYFLTVPVPIPLYHIHGDADIDATGVQYMDVNNIPDGDEYPIATYGYINCGNDIYTQSTIVTGVYKKTYCSAPFEVDLIQIAGMGHVWPNVSGYNASQAIWDFCSSYALPINLDCINENKEISLNSSFSISPNPSNGTYFLIAESEIESLKINNLIGQNINYEYNSNNNQLTILNHSNTIYFLTIYFKNGEKVSQKIIMNE
ncbi:MAG: T9SS type A sorting domain-containing protein [Flavobacteriia bacterium]|nr:T9SS type A sorting domain-containing protein [Flavobacteriia bacterium]